METDHIKLSGNCSPEAKSQSIKTYMRGGKRAFTLMVIVRNASGAECLGAGADYLFAHSVFTHSVAHSCALANGEKLTRNSLNNTTKEL